MKILHTADWHLGNTFHGHTRTAEHRHFLAWLLDQIAQKQPDALIVSGDVFDTPNPSAVAEELLYDFLLRATETLPGLQIVLTAGNHDSAGRLEAPSSLLKTHNVYVRGTIRYTDEGEPDFDYYLLPLADRTTGRAACMCMALPYLRGNDYPAGMTQEEGLQFFFRNLAAARKRSAFRHLPVVVAAHFYATGADICRDGHSERLVVGGQDCADIAVVGEQPSYIALGHIHKAQQIDAPTTACYAGSALPLSFSERNYTHGCQYVEIDREGGTAVSFIAYEPLRRLISIPQKGKSASASDVLDAIHHLPKRQKGDDPARYPYLEIRMEEKQPEPTLLHEVKEALADRAALFCRIVRTRADEPDNPTTPSNADEPLSAASAVEPAAMASAYFQRRYGSDMPQPLVERFDRALSEATRQSATNH